MKLVLVDRDGVVNEDRATGVMSLEELKIFPQALDAFALLNKNRFICALVTNQSVVGRGLISEADLEAIHAYLREQVAAHGGRLDAIYACTDHPDRPTPRRKPGAGMILEALADYGIAAEGTPFVGDSLGDLEAAAAAGCPRYLVLTGKGERTARALPSRLEPVERCADILDAARRIVTMG